MATISPETTMKTLNAAYPGARRALFAKYHIGGCSSCAYADDDSLLQVSKKNEFDINEAIQHILESHNHDAKMMLSPLEAAEKIKAGAKLIDIRTREEHEAVCIPRSDFMTQDYQQKAFANWGEDTVVILYDHTGNKSLDTCAWFRGHQLPHTFVIKGGIDAYAQEVDSSLARYRMELE